MKNRVCQGNQDRFSCSQKWMDKWLLHSFTQTFTCGCFLMPPGCYRPSPTREVHSMFSALSVSLSANKVEEIMWYIYVKEGCSRLCIKTHRINFTTSFKLALWSWWWNLQAMPAGRADLQHHPPQGGQHADVTRLWIMCTSLCFPLEVGYKWKSRMGVHAALSPICAWAVATEV